MFVEMSAGLENEATMSSVELVGLQKFVHFNKIQNPQTLLQRSSREILLSPKRNDLPVVNGRSTLAQ